MNAAWPPAAAWQPRRVLMSIDAVGGVWRYAMDLGRGLADRGTEVIFACFGPKASSRQVHEAASIGRLVDAAGPLDWIVNEESELRPVAGRIAELAGDFAVDLVHLNLPSQAAGLSLRMPVVAVSHSCVVTWFHAVRRTDVPPAWSWQRRMNAAGLRSADAVIAPSHSHADMLTACYGPVDGLRVVYNASQSVPVSSGKEPFVLAAGRWWDDGKNGRILDRAAAGSAWPVRMAGRQRGPNGQFMPIECAEYLGELPSAALRKLMARAAIVASPSLFEPFGLAALEGALSGAALVLSDIPTYRELWEGCAVFAPAHDAAAFADSLNMLADDPALRWDLGDRARRRAGRFSVAAQAERVLGVYRGAQIRHSGLMSVAG